jgi:hypothetical protein
MDTDKNGGKPTSLKNGQGKKDKTPNCGHKGEGNLL